MSRIGAAMAANETTIELEPVIVRPSEEQAEVDGSSRPTTATLSEPPAQTWVQRNRFRMFGIFSKVAGIASLLLTAILAWPAVASAGDTRMATLLAEWTSKKEYMEFCEAVS